MRISLKRKVDLLQNIKNVNVGLCTDNISYVNTFSALRNPQTVKSKKKNHLLLININNNIRSISLAAVVAVIVW